MLLGQHGGGDEHCYLLAILDGFKCGPECHFCFAKAHIATHQAIHGAVRFHVVFDIGNGIDLPAGFGVGEGRFEFALPLIVGGKGVAFAGAPFGVDGQQLVGEVLDRFARFAFGTLPFLGAEAGQGGLGVTRADVA